MLRTQVLDGMNGMAWYDVGIWLGVVDKQAHTYDAVLVLDGGVLVLRVRGMV